MVLGLVQDVHVVCARSCGHVKSPERGGRGGAATTDMTSLNAVVLACIFVLILCVCGPSSLRVEAASRHRFTVQSASRSEDLIVYTPRGYDDTDNAGRQYALILLLHPVQDTRIVRFMHSPRFPLAEERAMPTNATTSCVGDTRSRRRGLTKKSLGFLHRVCVCVH